MTDANSDGIPVWKDDPEAINSDCRSGSHCFVALPAITQTSHVPVGVSVDEDSNDSNEQRVPTTLTAISAWLIYCTICGKRFIAADTGADDE